MSLREQIKQPPKWKGKTIEKACPQCEVIFEARNSPSTQASGRGKFCSVKCSREARRKLPKTYKCQLCGREKENKYGKIKQFCSRECARKASFGRKPWNKDKVGISSGWPKGKKQTPEHIEKLRQQKIGTTPWNKGMGQGTPALRLRRSKKYEEWRKAVLERDRYCCVQCKSNKKIQADHIRPLSTSPWLALDVNNGQTLCKKCHLLKTAPETGAHMKVSKILKDLVDEGFLEIRAKEFHGIKSYEYRYNPQYEK